MQQFPCRDRGTIKYSAAFYTPGKHSFLLSLFFLGEPVAKTPKISPYNLAIDYFSYASYCAVQLV